jgi:hypothetical protein
MNFNKKAERVIPIMGVKHFEEVVNILNTNLSSCLNILVLGASDVSAERRAMMRLDPGDYSTGVFIYLSRE